MPISFKMTASVLDLESALARVGGDRELLGEIATLFLDDYPLHLAELVSAIERNDAPLVEKSAHALKGSVATFGATSAVQAALLLERAGRAQDLTGASQMMVDLQSLLTILHVELERLT